VSRWLEENPGASQREIRDGVGHRPEHVVAAIGVLVEEKWVRVERSGRRHEHFSVTAFRDISPLDYLTGSHGSRPVPGGSGTSPKPTGSHGSPVYVVAGELGTGRCTEEPTSDDDRFPVPETTLPAERESAPPAEPIDEIPNPFVLDADELGDDL